MGLKGAAGKKKLGSLMQGMDWNLLTYVMVGGVELALVGG